MRGMSVPPRTIALAALVLAAGVYFLWQWYRPPAPITTAGYLPAATEPVVAKLPKEDVAIEKVRVIPKTQAVKRLDLPSETVGKQEEILAAVTIPPTKGGATAVTLIDTDTGEARTIVREKPRPLLSLESGTEIGLRYGLSTQHGQMGAIYARRDLARMGDVYLSLYGEVSTRPEARGMVEISYRW